MTIRSWALIDDSRDDSELPQELVSEQFPLVSGQWAIRQKVLSSVLSDGVRLIEIDNGQMRVFVIPTRGMGIWKVEIADGGQGCHKLGWRSPVRGPVHPAHVPVFDPSGLGWLDGFDELVVRCGLESNGAPDFDEQGQLTYPLHGRIGNRPAHFVEVTVDDEAREIRLRGIVEETRFHFQKLRLETTLTIPFDATSLNLSDQVENFGGTPAEMQMLYHINIGEPLLTPGDKFIAPIETVYHRDRPNEKPPADWSHYSAGTPGKLEDGYFMTMKSSSTGETKVLLKNSQHNCGVAIGYHTSQLPCFTLWKNDVAQQDGYVTGLEPATNYPNCRSVEKAAGRVVDLPPGAFWSADLQIDYLVDGSAVEAVEKEIADLAS